MIYIGAHTRTLARFLTLILYFNYSLRLLSFLFQIKAQLFQYTRELVKWSILVFIVYNEMRILRINSSDPMDSK